MLIFPLAYPDMTLEGTVQSVASMAQTTPAHATGQKHFGTVIQVRNPNPNLRSGMTVRLRILTYSNPSALLIPRTALLWEDSQPFCRLAHGHTDQKVRVRTGFGNETHFEVLEGLAEGDRVILP